MLKADKAKKIISILNKIYPETPIPLNHNNNFELLISVLLSAQCTDKRVNEVTPLPVSYTHLTLPTTLQV